MLAENIKYSILLLLAVGLEWIFLISFVLLLLYHNLFCRLYINMYLLSFLENNDLKKIIMALVAVPILLLYLTVVSFYINL